MKAPAPPPPESQGEADAGSDEGQDAGDAVAVRLHFDEGDGELPEAKEGEEEGPKFEGTESTPPDEAVLTGLCIISLICSLHQVDFRNQ